LQAVPKETTDEIAAILTKGDTPPSLFDKAKAHMYASLQAQYGPMFYLR